MRELIENSEVIEIEADAVPFSHKLLDDQLTAIANDNIFQNSEQFKFH